MSAMLCFLLEKSCYVMLLFVVTFESIFLLLMLHNSNSFLTSEWVL